MPTSNFTNKNASHFMRLTEAQKVKARRKLIGSVIMLLIALIVLLNVTAHIKPIKVVPKTIEIRNTASSTIRQTSSTPTIAKMATQSVVSHPPTTNSTTSATVAAKEHRLKSTASQTAPLVVQPIVAEPIAVTAKSAASASVQASTTPNTSTLPHFVPLLMSENTITKASPDDILNGNVSSTRVSKHYYVQLTVSHDKNKLLQFKRLLAHKGIAAVVQGVNTASGDTVYRLRLGPFSTKAQANKAYVKLRKVAA